MTANNLGFAALDGELPPLVKPGDYEVALCSYKTWSMFGKAPKLTLKFKIVTFGPYFEVILERHYNVKRFIGKPGSNGGFKISKSGAFIREYSRLFGTPTRLDRIPMSFFEKNIFIARVRTVNKGSKQESLASGLEYSVIEELKGIKK